MLKKIDPTMSYVGKMVRRIAPSQKKYLKTAACALRSLPGDIAANIIMMSI
jgi:hypothetical protein